MSGGYLFDITAIVEVMRAAPNRHFIRRLSNVPSAERWTSTVVVGELLYAARKGGERSMMVDVLKVVAAIRVASFDTQAAITYGKLAASLDWAGAPITANDLMTVSIAKTLDMTLVTRRPQLFARIPQVRVIDWSQP